jgi:hypothetical protein
LGDKVLIFRFRLFTPPLGDFHLVYLKYTFRYMSQFDELNDDWLDAIEATSDELLGAYSKGKDEAMTTAFGARGKKRLNRVFDVIRFVYPDYCYPSRKQGTKRKAATSASGGTSRSKKVKVLTHRPRRIETSNVPKLTERATPIAEPSHSVPIEARTKHVEEPKLEKGVKAVKSTEPTMHNGTAEAIKHPRNNSKEKKNGQHAR